MITLRKVFAICMLAAPLGVAAQDNAAANAGHSEHAQHGVPSGATAGPPPADAVNGHMRDMRDRMMGAMPAESGMMRERIGAIEDRLASIEQLLQQLLEHQRGAEKPSASSRRERDRRR